LTADEILTVTDKKLSAASVVTGWRETHEWYEKQSLAASGLHEPPSHGTPLNRMYSTSSCGSSKSVFATSTSTKASTSTLSGGRKKRKVEEAEQPPDPHEKD